MSREFTVTYDYLCPFARNANEAIVEALQDGADWAVTFRPFSLSQNHTTAEDSDVWDAHLDTELASGVLALVWSLAVRDSFPKHFLSFHAAMFAARHDDAIDIGDGETIKGVVQAVGLDVDAVAAVVTSGVPQETLKTEHLGLVKQHAVFGVPTFIAGDEAVFVRFMDRHNLQDVERITDMLTWTNLNEFKRTSVPK
jgi:protein-disulfide isomerase-like protein with CxxC motif